MAGNTDEKAKPDVSKSEDGKLTVDEWAELKFPKNKRGHQHHGIWRHAAAAVLHGWAEHKHHQNGAMRLTEGEYDKALKAMDSPTATPHKAALSKHHPATKRAAEAKKG